MPPTRKRTADGNPADSTTPKPKKSKKEIREEAMARAKESMKADKAKVDAVKAKKKQQQNAGGGGDAVPTTPAKRTRVAEKRAPASTTKKKTPAAKTTGASAKKPSPAPKQAPVVPVAPPVAAAAQQQPFLNPMAAAAAQQRSQGMGFPMGSLPGMNTANMATMGYGLPTSVNPPMGSAAGVAQFMMQQQLASGGGNPAAVAAANMGFAAANMGFGSPHAAAAQLQMQQQAAAAAQGQLAAAQKQQPSTNTNQIADQMRRNSKPQSKPKAAAAKQTPVVPPPSPERNTATAIPESDDDDIPPPPGSLEMQISQQVLANVSALNGGLPTPHKQPPPEAFIHADDDGCDEIGDETYQDDQPIIVDYDGEGAVDAPPSPKKRRWGKGLIAAIVVAFIAYIVMSDEDGSTTKDSPKIKKSSTITTYPKSKQASCYYDTFVGDESEGYVPSCSDVPGSAPCPDGGVCEGGKLVSCDIWFEDVSKDGKSCVLSSEHRITLEKIMTVLEEKTLDQACSFLSFSSGNWPPLFDYAQVQLAKPLELATNPLDVAILENELVFEEKEGKHFIGLSDDHPLEIPKSCKAKMGFKSFISSVIGLMILGLTSALSFGWSVGSAYPIASVVGLIVVWGVRKRRQNQAYRSKLVRDIAQVRQMAYEILQDNPTASHVVLHVRDEITMTLHPDSKKERLYINEEVWPRLIPDIRSDNRVRKSTVVEAGKPRDVWRWAAATTSSSAKKASVAVAKPDQ